MHGGVDNYTHSVDLDFSVNLNPYELPASDKLAFDEAVASGIAGAGVYPDLLQRDVRAAVALSEGVGADCVMAGNGASELIMAVVAMAAPKKAFLVEPSFSGYDHALSAVKRCSVDRFYLSEENGFCVTEEAVPAIGDDTDLIILCDPDNPTGKNIDEGVLRMILEKARDIGSSVLLDESFYMLSYKSVCGPFRDTGEFLERYGNLYIIRSYTKSFALPGVRMGYVLTCPENVRRLAGYLPEWNLSSLAASVMKACAKTVLEGDFLRASLDYIQAERQFLVRGLEGLGLKVYESDTVFVLFKCVAGVDLYTALLDRKILIRDCADLPGLGKGYYRVAVRCRKDNEQLINVIGEVLSEAVNGR